MNTSEYTGTDAVCRYCGRPVLKDIVYGKAGPYHRECTEPPKTLIQDIMKQHQPPNFTSPAPIPYHYKPHHYEPRKWEEKYYGNVCKTENT
jgi:hypothetical protein